jgi:RecB family endonuclease NucS
MENAIHQIPSLWDDLGLSAELEKQVVWRSVGRADLVCGNTVIEVKKVVTTEDGPAQIERYLGHLAKKLRLKNDQVRGILVQRSTRPGGGVKDRLLKSPFHLELWSVDDDEDGDWRALQLV